MIVSPLTPKAIIIFFIFGSFLLIDRACAPTDQSMTDAKSRHEAAMKDLGRNDYYPVRSPWGNEGGAGK
jgi:hypothetical protein